MFGRRAIQCSNAFKRTIFTTPCTGVPVKVGDKLPSIELTEETPANKVNLQEALANKKAVIFAVPGAFTPGCSMTHLPGYVEKIDSIKGKGVDEVICISVNDAFVMDAWGKAHGAGGKIRMLADAGGAFTKALDMEKDLSGPLGNIRSKRYSMLVENGVVKVVNEEPDGTGLTCSLAPEILKSL